MLLSDKTNRPSVRLVWWHTLDGATMPLEKNAKQLIMQEHARHENDTGSPEVQVAILSTRITQLTDHLRTHSHDEHSRRGLLKLVGQRRRHLRYLSQTKPDVYRDLISKLGLRR